MNELQIVLLIVILMYQLRKKYISQGGDRAALQIVRDVDCLEKDYM
jgi:hypothetical protein